MHIAVFWVPLKHSQADRQTYTHKSITKKSIKYIQFNNKKSVNPKTIEINEQWNK